MTLYKSDIERIGFQTSESDAGFLAVTCDPITANVERIILRSVLKLFAFEITDERDFAWHIPGRKKQVDVMFITNMPWDYFCERKYRLNES